MTTILDTGEEFVNVDGQFVEVDALRIAEAIDDYDPSLRVLCVDPLRASFTDAPFIIAQVCPDGVLRKCFEAWKLDEEVLRRIEAADTTKHDIEAKLEWMRAEINKERKVRYEEKRLELIGIGTSVLKTHKSSFTYNDIDTGEKVTIHYNKPPERGNNAVSHL